MSVCPDCGRCRTCGQPAPARPYPYGIQPYIPPVYPYGVVSYPSVWNQGVTYTTNTNTSDEGGDDPAV